MRLWKRKQTPPHSICLLHALDLLACSAFLLARTTQVAELTQGTVCARSLVHESARFAASVTVARRAGTCKLLRSPRMRRCGCVRPRNERLGGRMAHAIHSGGRKSHHVLATALRQSVRVVLAACSWQHLSRAPCTQTAPGRCHAQE